VNAGINFARRQAPECGIRLAAAVCAGALGEGPMAAGSQGRVFSSWLQYLALYALVLVLPSIAATAQGPPPEKLPRFASLRSDDVNLRVGPGETYPIAWVLKRKDMPVEIIEQFQNWRQVRDWQGDKGWVLDRMVTGKRDVIIDGGVRALRREPDPASPIVARAEPGVIARLIELKGVWCRIEAGGYRGWVQRSEIWGVYLDETTLQ
jgi:SH3-like domain-containing protein